jgi:hypothetical protein
VVQEALLWSVKGAEQGALTVHMTMTTKDTKTSAIRNTIPPIANLKGRPVIKKPITASTQNMPTIRNNVIYFYLESSHHFVPQTLSFPLFIESHCDSVTKITFVSPYSLKLSPPLLICVAASMPPGILEKSPPQLQC